MSVSLKSPAHRKGNLQKYVDGIALGRAQTPDDVAALVAFPASDDSDYITGRDSDRRRYCLPLTYCVYIHRHPPHAECGGFFIY